MPLIVAIEPDRRQTAKLTMIGSNQLRAELFVAESVRQALTTLDERLPDLILVSPLLLPRDLAALNERLRELEKDGFKVPTLTIPVLEVSSQRTRPQAQQKGAPNRTRVTRGPRAIADACDPTTFGLQVAAYLERAMHERPAASTAFRPKASSVESIEEDAEELIEAEPEEAAAESTTADAEPEWHDVLSALRRDLHIKAEHSEPAVPAPPAPKPAPPIVAQAQPPGTRPQPIVIRPAAPAVVAEQPPAPVAALPATGAPKADPQVKKRRPKSPPAQDEWGMFDPQQCGLAALRVKLNEITQGPGQKKPA